MTKTLTIGIVFLLILTQLPLNLGSDDVQSWIKETIAANPQISEELRAEIEEAFAGATSYSDAVSIFRSQIPEELRTQIQAAFANQLTLMQVSLTASATGATDSLKGNPEMKVNRRNKHKNVAPAMAKLSNGNYVVT